MKTITLYTDGACSGNPGAGGWGCVLMYKNEYKELSGYNALTTNNQMELFAVIQGLKALNQPCYVNLFSDSAYVVNAFTQGWIDNWIKKDWKNSQNQEVKNVELWQELLELCKIHKITWNKVKGHADNEHNNRCDFLATNEIAKHSKIENN